MRIVKLRIDRYDHPTCRVPAELRDWHAYYARKARITATAVEGRIVLNRFEAKALDAALWVREQWHEQVTYRLGRLLCRLLGWHNVTCRGRADHDGTEALRWPHR